MIHLRAIVMGALLVTVACIGSAAAQPVAAVKINATAPNSAVRDCTSAEVRKLIAGFIHAFNAGNTARLDALFAKDDGDHDAATASFQWYSTGAPGQRFGRAADDRSTLMHYFAVRHSHGEHLELLWMSHGGSGPGNPYFGFGFRIYRKARDLPRPGTFLGKGAAICVTGRPQIAVWSVGPRIPRG